MSGFDPAVLVTAFLAGLLGSGHCFGMCGGIAGSLGALSGGTDRRSLVLPAVQFNLGRLLGYAVLGAIAAGFIGAAGEIMALKPVGRYLRLLTAVMVLLIGLRFLVDWRGLDVIERGGAGLWRRIMPLATRISQRHDWIGRTGLGICWGFLPCGLVYTVLMTAASTAPPVTTEMTAEAPSRATGAFRNWSMKIARSERFSPATRVFAPKRCRRTPASAELRPSCAETARCAST